ncbi:hypothetical protein Q3G72_029057 [Acer saccharum]|nr:hypothetical protein Q3G72_029057 [Acer saccharum]
MCMFFAATWVKGPGGVGNVKLMESILDIREILFRNGSKVSVQFVPRNGNVLADLQTGSLEQDGSGRWAS